MIVVAQRHRRRLFFVFGAAIAVIGGLTAMAFSTAVEPDLQATRSGTVIDAETQRPLAGAHVVARWWHISTNRFPPIGHGQAGGYANCLHREVARTDPAGLYKFPAIHGAFRVERTFDLKRKNEYRWQLDAYAPGYYDQSTRNPSRELHPEASKALIDDAVDVAPLKLTKDTRPRAERVADLVGLGLDLSCAWTTTESVPFVPSIYDEAFRLACESGEPTGVLGVAKLRQDSRSIKPDLPEAIAHGLTEVSSRYRPNEIPTLEDQARLCELLIKAKKATPP